MTTQNPRLLTLKDVAQILGTSPQNAKRLRSQGNHPLLNNKAIKLGGSIRWKDTDVTTYIDNLPYEN